MSRGVCDSVCFTMYFLSQLLMAILMFQTSALREDCVTAYCASETSNTTKSLPIRTVLNHSPPLPRLSEGGVVFADGVTEIDLGGLVVRRVTSYIKVWEINTGGPDDEGAAFSEPLDIPEGYFMLGSIAQAHNVGPVNLTLLVGKDQTYSRESLTMAKPTNYTLVWSSVGLNPSGDLYAWLPMAPLGYKAVGHVLTASSEKPSTNKVRCVRSDFIDQCQTESWIWGDGLGKDFFMASTEDIEGRMIQVGTFDILPNGPDSAVFSCLKNKKLDMSWMPSKHNK